MTAEAEGKPFTITGTDWPTRDGSAIRDYVHVWDLARAHVQGLLRFDTVTSDRPYRVINLGTGVGTTVRELVAAFRDVSGSSIEVHEAPPRPGDVVGAYALSKHATALLDWRAERGVTDGIRDALAWRAVRPAVLGY